MNNRIGQRIITECLQLPAVLFSYLVRAVALLVNKDRAYCLLFLTIVENTSLLSSSDYIRYFSSFSLFHIVII